MDTQDSFSPQYSRHTKNKARKRPKRSSVVLFPVSSIRPGGAAPALLGVHDEQIVCRNLVPFPARGRYDGGPVMGGDSSSLAPSLRGLLADTGLGGQLGQRTPNSKQVPEVFHNPLISGDELSRLHGAIVPVTENRAHRTISPMGRAKTPVQFNKALAARLRAARIAAGYDTQAPFAKELGIELERYKKWESGRTPISSTRSSRSSRPM
jgi:DNA-binding XRE family transcriptional regulator